MPCIHFIEHAFIMLGTEAGGALRDVYGYVGAKDESGVCTQGFWLLKRVAGVL